MTTFEIKSLANYISSHFIINVTTKTRIMAEYIEKTAKKINNAINEIVTNSRTAIVTGNRLAVWLLAPLLIDCRDAENTAIKISIGDALAVHEAIWIKIAVSQHIIIGNERLLSLKE